MRVNCVFCGLFALALCCLPSRDAEAGDAASQFPEWAKLKLPPGRAELSNGFDMTANGWGGYSNAVVALDGPLDRDGWRVKLSGGYGSYHYKTSDRTVCKKIHDVGHTTPDPALSEICKNLDDLGRVKATPTTVQYLSSRGMEIVDGDVVADLQHIGTTYDVGIAPGYQFTIGALILKGYLGLEYEARDTSPPDASKPLNGSYWGAQAGIEAWLPLGADAWVSAYGSYFTGTSSHSASMQLGYKPLPWLSLGPEIATFGNEDDNSARAGGFVKVDALGMETTLSAGLSGTYKDDPSAYGAASIYMKF
jgi:hypothetical protein